MDDSARWRAKSLAGKIIDGRTAFELRASVPWEVCFCGREEMRNSLSNKYFALCGMMAASFSSSGDRCY